MRSVVLCCSLLLFFGCGVAASIHNSNILDEINPGDNYAQVTDKLLGPKQVEAFYELGHSFKVIEAKAGSVTNHVPFVFLDDTLVGYGHDFYDRFSKARHDPSGFGKLIDQMIMSPPSSLPLENKTSSIGQDV
jgi:hypothetical protein